jgi:hypothetical protein
MARLLIAATRNGGFLIIMKAKAAKALSLADDEHPWTLSRRARHSVSRPLS